MHRTTTLAIALGFALATAGTAAAQVKIGVEGPITGPNAAFGAQLKNGAEQAVADINAKGGILGKKIELSFGDDVSDPKQGVSVANKFVGDGVKFVVGAFNSGVTMPSSEVYQENGILEITPASTNPKITERGMWNIFRTCGRDDQQGAVAAAYILKHFKGKKVAVVDDKTTYGKGLADETVKALGQGRDEAGSARRHQHRRQGFLRAGVQDQAIQGRPGLLGRPAHRRRIDRAADARSGREDADDGRRRHHLG